MRSVALLLRHPIERFSYRMVYNLAKAQNSHDNLIPMNSLSRPDIQVLKSDVSGLLQLVSYVKFKVKAGSGGVVLGPMKYLPPVFCRADYCTHFGGSQLA